MAKKFKIIGSQLQKARELAHVSRVQLGAKIGLSTTAIREYEEKGRQPTDFNVVAMANFLKADAMDLCKDGEMKSLDNIVLGGISLDKLLKELQSREPELSKKYLLAMVDTKGLSKELNRRIQEDIEIDKDLTKIS